MALKLSKLLHSMTISGVIEIRYVHEC